MSMISPVQFQALLSLYVCFSTRNTDKPPPDWTPGDITNTI